MMAILKLSRLKPIIIARHYRRPLAQVARISSVSLPPSQGDGKAFSTISFTNPISKHTHASEIASPHLYQLSREFSTKSTEADTPSSPAQRTTQIHASPIGSLTSRQWKDAIEDLVDFWTHSTTTNDVKESVRLLERLVEERSVNRKIPKKITDALNAKILEKVVLHWESWRNLQPTAQELGPEDVLAIVDDFKNCVAALPPSDTPIYNAIMAAFISTEGKDPKECAQRVQELFDRIAEPTSKSYESLIRAYIQAGDMEHAIDILDRVLDATNTEGEFARLGSPILKAALAACASASYQKGGLLAEDILDRMWELHDTQGMDCKPNEQSYTCVMDAWAGSGHPEAGFRAENTFSDMLQRSNQDSDLAPSTASLNSLANAFLKSGMVEQAASIAENMCIEFEQGNERLRPDLQTFSIIMNGIARKRGPKVGQVAEEFLRKMVKFGVPPTAVSYRSTIHAWSQSGSRQAGQAATRLLQEMIDRARTNPELKPNVKSYTSAMHAWAKSGNRDAGAEAEKLLREMMVKGRNDPDVKPDVKSFSAVIDAWAKSGHRNAGVEAERLLREMIVEGRDDPDIKPDAASFSSAIDAWAKSGHRNAGVEAAKLLREMMVKARDDPDMKPNVRSFNSAINAWAKSGHINAGVEAVKLLQEIVEGSDDPDMKPDVTSFNSAINAWAKSGHPNAGVEAEKVLREMILKGRDNPVVSPDTKSFNSAINAWASQDNFERAEALLEEMGRSKQRAIQPDVITFTAVINALSKSPQMNKGERADQYLQDMENLYMKPNLVTYKMVFKCWTKSNATPKAKTRLKELNAMIAKLSKEGGGQKTPKRRRKRCG